MILRTVADANPCPDKRSPVGRGERLSPLDHRSSWLQAAIAVFYYRVTAGIAAHLDLTLDIERVTSVVWWMELDVYVN